MVDTQEYHMQINWSRCLTYSAAAKSKGVVYLHEWYGVPFYWGSTANFRQRNNSGYSHWIEGVLQHGGRLYIGKPEKLGQFTLEDVEKALINKYGSIRNKRRAANKLKIFTHTGNVPESIQKSGVPNPIPFQCECM